MAERPTGQFQWWGIYLRRRDIFTNADLFELEIKQPFEPNWGLWKT